MSFLPLSHVAANTTDIILWIMAMGTIYFAQPDALKVQALKIGQHGEDPTPKDGARSSDQIMRKFYQNLVNFVQNLVTRSHSGISGYDA